MGHHKIEIGGIQWSKFDDHKGSENPWTAACAAREISDDYPPEYTGVCVHVWKDGSISTEGIGGRTDAEGAGRMGRLLRDAAGLALEITQRRRIWQTGETVD